MQKPFSDVFWKMVEDLDLSKKRHPLGTNESSNNYAKTRRHDVQDFNVILAAAGGRYDWMTPGVTDLKNPLQADESALLATLEEKGQI